jgi:hypothetical protein
MPRQISPGSSFWARLRGDALSGNGSGDDSSNPLAFEQFNRDIGQSSDTAATSDTGTFSLISLFKRLLARVSNVHAVLCTGTWAGSTGDNAAASGTIPAPGAGFATFIKGYTFSYSAAIPAPRNLTITDTSGNIVDVDVTAAGPGPVEVGELAATNAAVTFSLPASGTAGVIGRIRIYYTTLAVI